MSKVYKNPKSDSEVEKQIDENNATLMSNESRINKQEADLTDVLDAVENAQSNLESDANNEVAVVHHVTVPTTIGATSVQLPLGKRLKRLITVPSLVLKNVNVAHCLRLDTPFRKSKIPGKKKADGTFEDPATIADVTNIEDGHVYVLLAPNVVISNLEREYPDHSYVGKSFYIINLGRKKEGQRHVDYGIAELEDDGRAQV